jgi:proteasome lid subunit RPN8/RPN11
MYFLHAGETEVGGFGVAAEHDLLYVQDFVTLKQRTSCVSVEFADDAVADYFDTCVDAGLPPARFARIWCHTHPGHSPQPSHTDERTFARVFGSCDWSVMFIISRTGETYARLAFNAGPGGRIHLPVEVDWDAWPQLIAMEGIGLFERAWMAEYERNIDITERRGPISFRGWDDDPDDPYDLTEFMGSVMNDPTVDEQAVFEFEGQEGVRS